MQIADLELVIADIAPVEIFKTTDFEQRPVGGAFCQRIKDIPIALVLSLALAQHDFENYLISFTLYAINCAKSVFVLQIWTIADEGNNEVMFSDLWQFRALRLYCFRLLHRVEPSHRNSEELFDPLSLHVLVMRLSVASMLFDCGDGVFADDGLELAFEQALVVVQVIIGCIEVCLLLIDTCTVLLLIDDVLEQMPVADLLVEFVDLVRHLLHSFSF